MEDAEIVIVSYGISARTSLTAVDEARAMGIRAGLLRLITVWPFPEEQIREIWPRGSRALSPWKSIWARSTGGGALRRRQGAGLSGGHAGGTIIPRTR